MWASFGSGWCAQSISDSLTTPGETQNTHKLSRILPEHTCHNFEAVRNWAPDHEVPVYIAEDCLPAPNLCDLHRNGHTIADTFVTFDHLAGLLPSRTLILHSYFHQVFPATTTERHQLARGLRNTNRPSTIIWHFPYISRPEVQTVFTVRTKSVSQQHRPRRIFSHFYPFLLNTHLSLTTPFTFNLKRSFSSIASRQNQASIRRLPASISPDINPFPA